MPGDGVAIAAITPKIVLVPTHAPPKDYRFPKQPLDPHTCATKTAIAKKTLKQMIPKP